MFRPGWKHLIVGGIVAASITMGVSRAEATWWWGCWRPASCCYTAYTPCYTVSCDPCCYGSCYVGLRPGPVRRLLLGPYRWYYGGWGSCSYSCCSYPCCYDCSAIVDIGPTRPPAAADKSPSDAPAAKTPASPKTAPDPAKPAGAKTGRVGPRATSGLLTISVPAEATVTVNGYQTKTTGSLRRYVSQGLKPGFVYKYELRARIVDQGKPIEATETVYLTAGTTKSVALDFNSQSQSRLAALR